MKSAEYLAINPMGKVPPCPQGPCCDGRCAIQPICRSIPEVVGLKPGQDALSRLLSLDFSWQARLNRLFPIRQQALSPRKISSA